MLLLISILCQLNSAFALSVATFLNVDCHTSCFVLDYFRLIMLKFYVPVIFSFHAVFITLVFTPKINWLEWLYHSPQSFLKHISSYICCFFFYTFGLIEFSYTCWDCNTCCDSLACCTCYFHYTYYLEINESANKELMETSNFSKMF